MDSELAYYTDSEATCPLFYVKFRLTVITISTAVLYIATPAKCFLYSYRTL